jgi:hypothetical protein
MIWSAMCEHGAFIRSAELYVSSSNLKTLRTRRHHQQMYYMFRSDRTLGMGEAFMLYDPNNLQNMLTPDSDEMVGD